MKYSEFVGSHSVTKCAVFVPAVGNGGELHSIIKVTNPYLAFSEQLSELVSGLGELCRRSSGYSPVMVRLFLSDAANQAEMAMREVRSVVGDCALGYVQQPLLNGTKIGAWVYMMQDVEVERLDQYSVAAKRGEYSHIWSASVCNSLADTEKETYAQLEYLEGVLKDGGLNIADNCVRTWFFVQNIDVNYAAVVEARKANFADNGLTVDTHYISSTGIGGRHADKRVTSLLDAYSVSGLKEGQMRYIYAAENMNRTSDYGVTFERGTYVDYADRRQIFISGTASIDNKGSVVAEGDIVAQTGRMLENVEALLKEAESSFEDVAHIIVYLRDVADYAIVSKMFGDRFGEKPVIITLAPVCRPGWLIEMECMAVANR